MDIAAQIAKFKQENGLPILQSAREREKLNAVSGLAREDMRRYLRVLYSVLFELSRTYKGALYRNDTELYRTICAAIDSTPKVFPKQAAVACQGVEGAYAQLACERLFSAPSIQFFRNFDGILGHRGRTLPLRDPAHREQHGRLRPAGVRPDAGAPFLHRALRAHED